MMNSSGSHLIVAPCPFGRVDCAERAKSASGAAGRHLRRYCPDMSNAHTDPTDETLADQSPHSGPDDRQFSSKDDDLVAAIPHLGPVLEALHRLGFPHARVEDENKRLGLALVKFGDGALSAEVMQQVASRHSARGLPLRPTDRPGPILDAIRDLFGKRGQWHPIIGRNRTVGSVNGVNGHPIISCRPPQITRNVLADADFPEKSPDERRRRIGIIDTPLRHHEWLVGAAIAPMPRPFRPDEDEPGGPTFRASHSTALVGSILSRSPSAQVFVEPGLDDDGVATSWDIAKSIVGFSDSGGDLLNLSLACYTDDGEPPLALAEAIAQTDRRMLIIAAAGNFGDPQANQDPTNNLDLTKAPAWPAAIPGVVAVGSVDSKGRRSVFSPDAPWVDVETLGEDVVSLMVDHVFPGISGPKAFASWSGTSFSTARLTGWIAQRSFQQGIPVREVWEELADGIAKAENKVVRT